MQHAVQWQPPHVAGHIFNCVDSVERFVTHLSRICTYCGCRWRGGIVEGTLFCLIGSNGLPFFHVANSQCREVSLVAPPTYLALRVCLTRAFPFRLARAGAVVMNTFTAVAAFLVPCAAPRAKNRFLRGCCRIPIRHVLVRV